MIRMFLSALIATVFLVAADHARAATVYAYQGTTYDPSRIVDSAVPTGNYDATMSISAQFVLTNPLASELDHPDLRPDVIGFTVSDGRHTLDDSNSTLRFFRISTDGTGAITEWSFGVAAGSLDVKGDQYVDIVSLFRNSVTDTERVFVDECLDDSAEFVDCRTGSDTARNGSNPGTWSVVPVPVPSAALLLGTALAGFVGLGRRTRRKRTA